jgi:signal transduction histidine kinase
MKDLAEDSAAAERRRIAHDLSNQIMVVQGNLELLRLKLPGEEGLRSHLELASEAVERCRVLTDRLSDLCREDSAC